MDRTNAQHSLARGSVVGGVPAGYATPPVWGVPSSQGIPSFGGAQQMLAVGTPASTSLVACSQAAPHQPPTASMNEEIANKAAEITVLRSRMQVLERDNLKMKNEVAISKDKGAQNDRVRQMQGEVERLNNELRYSKQDLISSEEERKRLKTSWEGAHLELKAVKSEKNAPVLAAPLANTMPPPLAAPTPDCSPSAMQSRRHSIMPGTFVSEAPSGGFASSPVATQPFRPMSATKPAATQAHVASPVSAGAMTQPLWSVSSTPSPTQGKGLLPSPSRAQSKQWRQDVLLRELACWEAASKAVSGGQAEPSASWFALRETVGRLTSDRLALRQQKSNSKGIAANHDLATAVTAQLQAACRANHWVVVQGGARFIQVLIGLFPDAVNMLKPQAAAEHAQPQVGTVLLDELTQALHAVVLDSKDADVCGHGTDPGDGYACATQLLKTLAEIVGKLRPHELDSLGSVFKRPSLCALLVESPSSGSLHVSCMGLLQALLASTELYALAHGADNPENPLLAVANLLVIPGNESCSGEGAKSRPDNPELQQCRVSALQVFCRCLATAPRLDMVLQLRGASNVDGETVETVLQRVAFLCHHELLCLGIHGVDGGSWHDQSLQECAKKRQCAIELSLTILSSFVWHAIPDVHAPDQATAEAKAEALAKAKADHAKACSDACAALGRMRPLVASIVDMVARRAARSPFYTRLLGSASALRVLLAHADGEDGCIASGDGGAALGSRVMAPMMVVD